MAAALSSFKSPDFWRRFAQLQLGLCLFGMGIGLFLGANVGLDPWSTFHEGVSAQCGLSFGRVTQIVGVVLVGAAWFLFKERPGAGTLFNMTLVGPWVDLFRPHLDLATGPVSGLGQFILGLLIIGLASGLYISARFGAGPRDGFILGAARQLGKSVRITRMGIELLMLGLGWGLGGPVGLGTILFALSMGPLMQYSLKLFGYQVRSQDKNRRL